MSKPASRTAAPCPQWRTCRSGGPLSTRPLPAGAAFHPPSSHLIAMQIKSRKDFVSGLMFIGAGAAFAIGATNYKVGDAARMGPGYFPLILGCALALMGTIVLLGSFTA